MPSTLHPPSKKFYPREEKTWKRLERDSARGFAPQKGGIQYKPLKELWRGERRKRGTSRKASRGYGEEKPKNLLGSALGKKDGQEKEF